MRLSVVAAAVAVLTLAAPARAQSADVRVMPHPRSVYVAPHGAGEAVRVTTYERRPSLGARLDRYRGVRVFREGAAAPAVAVQATPVDRVRRSPDGRFVQRGGASFPVTRR
jgi:hypothetical protein